MLYLESSLNLHQADFEVLKTSNELRHSDERNNDKTMIMEGRMKFLQSVYLQHWYGGFSANHPLQ